MDIAKIIENALYNQSAENGKTGIETDIPGLMRILEKHGYGYLQREELEYAIRNQNKIKFAITEFSNKETEISLISYSGLSEY